MGVPIRGCALALAGLLLGSPAAAEERVKLDDAARAKIRAEILADALAEFKRAADFLAGQRSFRLEAELGWDVAQPSGRMFEFGGTRKVTVRRPDRVRVEARSRDGEQNSLFFDGKRIAIAIPHENAYVLVDKPGSLDDAMDYLALELDTPVPQADIVQSDFYAEISERIVAGIDLGDSRVDGVDCQHLAFDAGEVDFQIWIEDGDRPLPRRLVITYKNEPGNPQFWARLHGWKLGAKVPDAVFAFQPAAGAERIPFAAASREIAQERGGR